MADRPTLFVDRSLGKGVGHRLREGGARVELHDDHFGQNTPDSTWIPDVTARGWVILTKDKNIRRPHGEREDILTAGARVFTLASGNLNGQQMAEIFTQHLTEIEGSRRPLRLLTPWRRTGSYRSFLRPLLLHNLHLQPTGSRILSNGVGFRQASSDKDSSSTSCRSRLICHFSLSVENYRG